MKILIIIVAIIVASNIWHVGALGLLLVAVVLLVKWLSMDPFPAPVPTRKERAGSRPRPTERRQLQRDSALLEQFCAPFNKGLIDETEPVFKMDEHLKGSPNFRGDNTLADPTWNPYDQD